MRASRIGSVLAPFVVLAGCFVPSASATTIDFNTLPGAYFSDFSTYTENGFTVATKTGHFYVDNGLNPVFGNPAPDIFADDSHSGQFAESLVITKVGGGSFTLTSFDFFASNATPVYTITGTSGATQVYNVTGLLQVPGQNVPANSYTFNSGVNGQMVTSVVIAFNDTGLDPLDLAGVDLDNFVLNGTTPVTPGVTPEPGSLVLLGTGVLGLGGLIRRRLAK